MDLEDVFDQVIREELRLQRKPIDFDLEAVVRKLVFELEADYEITEIIDAERSH